jgi:hypothetical protein
VSDTKTVKQYTYEDMHVTSQRMYDAIHILGIDHHRNGVSGEGFYAVKFEYLDEDNPKTLRGKPIARTMVASIFPGHADPCIAVYDVEILASDTGAEFGPNSWRGDHFYDPLLQYIREDDYANQVRNYGSVQWASGVDPQDYDDA